MIPFASYSAAVLSIVLGAVGQMFLKIGATRLAAGGAQGDLLGPLGRLLLNWPLLLGLGLYATSAMVWIYVLSRIDLSVAYPMVGLSFVMVLLLSVTVLGESVSMMQFAGCALIFGGILMVARG